MNQNNNMFLQKTDKFTKIYKTIYVICPFLTYLNNKNGPLSPKMGRFGAIYKVKNNFPDSFGKDHGLQLEPSVNFVLFTWFTYRTSGLEHPIF